MATLIWTIVVVGLIGLAVYVLSDMRRFYRRERDSNALMQEVNKARVDRWRAHDYKRDGAKPT